MATRRELSLEEKVKLIEEIKQGVSQNDDLPGEEPPTLSGCLELVRCLRLFSIMQQSELHSFIIQLESKLTDTLLDSNLSKQRSILD
ncbi:unnamed protein product [Rotaria magnacalcarata]|uniref:Uncharacterized protein n=1 Tax=Rotaria magnacalcarata TaxID=392030 RepID=A0A816UEF4_9BILA|nr:unnamed protein product [Rotaria magnacalcarata]CAF2107177.1 unnamed protein product [Rotaria magnacalcarata]CAF4014618.1 unnamed protein product [Rotaria magnacalcarata]CAF4048902.1 unnamed protein product [Rotaria magnacalcarata]CAF4396892.1 unnamed protein product [Rotaria magnacalcarata]